MDWSLEQVYLDFPLYAVPLERFKELREAALSKSSAVMDSIALESIRLDPKEVYLARRDKEHWVKSDPKKIKLWFDREKEVHGNRLVRVCRYLKAWRDFTWDKGGPTSISLMACAVSVFDESDKFERDCEALYAVAERLPKLFSDEIKNPAEPEESLYPRDLSEEIIDDIVNKAKIFRDKLAKALIHADNPQEVVNFFINSLGDRIPNDSNYVIPIASVSTAPDISQSTPTWNDTEQFIEDMYQVDIRNIIKIDCDVFQNGFMVRKLRDLLRRKFPLKPEKELNFRITESDILGEYDIYWKVLNRGDEAKKRNEIRGQIVHDSGFKERREYTKFRGEHVVECYAIQNGVVIAKDRIDVPIQ